MKLYFLISKYIFLLDSIKIPVLFMMKENIRITIKYLDAASVGNLMGRQVSMRRSYRRT